MRAYTDTHTDTLTQGYKLARPPPPTQNTSPLKLFIRVSTNNQEVEELAKESSLRDLITEGQFNNHNLLSTNQVFITYPFFSFPHFFSLLF